MPPTMIMAGALSVTPVHLGHSESKLISFDRNFITLLCFFLVFVMPLCASVYLCLVVTCWERAGLLALVCDFTFPLVSWVRCGT